MNVFAGRPHTRLASRVNGTYVSSILLILRVATLYGAGVPTRTFSTSTP